MTKRSEPATSDKLAVVIYDAECGMCRGWAQFAERCASPGRARFVPRASPEAQELLREHGLPAEPGSIVLVEGGVAYTRSEAVLRICRGLTSPWSWLATLVAIPRAWRDAAYDFVAARRGRIGACRIGPLDALERERGDPAGEATR